jgi:signal transduction histidine kinase/ligand-binding sensor domain-containing protein
LITNLPDNAAMPALMSQPIRLCIVCGLSLCLNLLGLSRGAASETRLASEDYLLKTWDTEDNLAGSTVTAILQTPDGYLWVGTYEGLTRFDGVHSVTFDSLNTPALSHSRIQGLYLDARGTLWINTYRGGLTSYRDGIFHREWPDEPDFDLHTMMVSSSSNQVTFVTQFGEILDGSLDGANTTKWTVLRPPGNSRPKFQCVDAIGTLWFLSREGRILRVLDGQYSQLASDCGLADTQVLTLTSDADGRVWAGAVNEIARWNGQTFEDFTPTNLDTSKEFDPITIFPASNGAVWVLANDRLRKEVGRRWTAEAVEWRGLLGSASNRAMGVHEDQNGGIWFNHYGNGVFYITPTGRFERFTIRNGLPGDRVGAWFQDRDGGIWFGVDRGGLVRLSTRHFQIIGQVEGLPVWPALSVCQDAGRTVWIGTAGGGLGCYQDGNLVDSTNGAVPANFIFSIFPESNGDLWLSAGDGEDLFQFHDGKIQRSPWGIHGVKSLLVDRAGRLWVGTKINVGWYTETSRRVFGTADGVADSPVRALAEAPDGTMWSGADDGTLYHCESSRVQAFQPSDAMGARPIWSLLIDPDGTVWAGTFRGGLLRFRNGQFTRFSTKQGLPDVISQILEDKRGRLWLGTHEGICCVEPAALEACASGKANTVDVIRHVGGLPTLVCSDGYQPACWHADAGRLLFTTVKGVVSVDPEKLAGSSLPPPVAIEDVLVDGQSVPLSDQKLVIPPGHEQFEFRFTALSFEAPEQSRFRYRIVGLDKGWVEADTRRVADYGHLPPNDYRFQVIACNSDGVWNKTGAALDFTVQPYFYQTRSFIVIMSVLILSGVGLTVRTIATRKYRRALARLEQQHAIEKDRARIAKDIHDDIGAGLTQITLLSELGRRETNPAGAQWERISDAARDLTRSMDEIVWAVDPQRDTLASLIDYISAYSEDFLRTAGIRCRMDFPAAVPAMQIEAELRYNLFLALKETLNNIVKHAQASEVWLRLSLTPAAFTLAVEDNGHGFETNNGGKAADSVDRLNSGHGLPNLRKRLEAIGGRCVMQSSPGKGTRIEMTVILHSATSSVMAIGGNRH